MAITAVVDNGQIVNNGVPDSEKEKASASKSGSAVDQDMFLQLLVAEMKYQDPMEPTSNTEWVSQYATFTQVEQGNQMQDSMKQMEAANLVGKEVIMKSTNESSGETTYITGKVDYMYVENGDVFLSVNNNLYNIDDLDTVVNDEYLDAVNATTDIKNMMDKMPSEKLLTLADATLVEQIRAQYDKLSEYQKGFLDDSVVSKLKTLENRIAELKKLAEEEKNTEETTEETATTDTSEETATTDTTSEGE